MDSIISLCTLPFLDNSYQNVLDFGSLSSQYSYFNQQTKKQIKGNVVNDSEREQITLNTPLRDIRNYDYLFLTGEDNKRYFYFITNKTYKTSSTCIVDVELDVYSTYLFDHSLLDSFVERTHVKRWNGSIPTNEVVDESFPNYDYIIIEKEVINSGLKNNYIISASSPLGKVSSVGNSGGNNGTIGGGGDLDDFPETRKITNEVGEWLIPTIGQVTATYPTYPASFGGGSHSGIDIAWKQGTYICAARAGEVIYTRTTDPGTDYGKYVKIDHGDGIVSYYAHCDTILCNVGDVVNAGEYIATQGTTGNSTGVHLHWEIRVNGVAINPDCSEVDSERKLPVGAYVEYE